MLVCNIVSTKLTADSQWLTANQSYLLHQVNHFDGCCDSFEAFVASF